MPKAARDLIKSLTPENRNLVLLLQMRMGHYMDGEITICKRVIVLNQNDREYICPTGNPSVGRMNYKPLQLNAEGDLFLSPIALQGGCNYVGMLDIMVGAEELAQTMRTVSALKSAPAAMKGVDVAIVGNEMLSSDPAARINPDIVLTQNAIQRRLVGPWDGPGWDEGMSEEQRDNRLRLWEMASEHGEVSETTKRQILEITSPFPQLRDVDAPYFRNPIADLPESLPLPDGGRDARKFREVTVGELEPLPDRSDVQISLHRTPRQSPIRIHGESEIWHRPGMDPAAFNLNEAELASLLDNANQESRSAVRSVLLSKSPLSDSEYFNRKMQIPGYEPTPVTFWTRMAMRWESFKERVAESRIGRFFYNLFNR